MKTVSVRDLDVAAFLPYGFYSGMIDPDAIKMGDPPVEFYRDMVQQNLGGTSIASFSVCRVEKRDPVINFCECHSSAGEGILPLDNDVLIHVAPATSPRAGVSAKDIEVYRVPMGTMVVLRPGVWHGAPYTANDDPANVLIVLPERTYANDFTFELLDENAIQIEM